METTLPLGLAAGSSVGILYLGEPPVITRAVVGASEEDRLHLVLSAPAAIPIGAKIVLELPSRERPRALARVVGNEGAGLVVSMGHVAPPERREYPRFRGWIRLRWRVGDAEQAVSWLGGDEIMGVEHTPHPDMEVSATGLAFDDGPWAQQDDWILMTVGVPGDASAHRAIARVVKVRELEDAERTPGTPGTHRFAVAIDPRCVDTIGALAQYTLRVQRAVNGEEGKRPARGVKGGSA